MHLAVAFGFQGADEDAEKLSLTNQLFDAAVCELAIVSRGQPCLIAGDFNVEPTKIPCLLNSLSAGLWIDLEASWARAAGSERAVICKRDWVCLGSTERDFVVGCPWLLRPWVGVGLIAAAGFSFISRFVILLSLSGGLLG